MRIAKHYEYLKFDGCANDRIIYRTQWIYKNQKQQKPLVTTTKQAKLTQKH